MYKNFIKTDKKVIYYNNPQELKFNPKEKFSAISFHKENTNIKSTFFCAEASDIQWNYSLNTPIKLINTLTNNSILFSFERKIMDSSNEDILVFVFKSIEGVKFSCEFHILND